MYIYGGALLDTCRALVVPRGDSIYELLTRHVRDDEEKERDVEIDTVHTLWLWSSQ